MKQDTKNFITKIDGRLQNFKILETILEVKLDKPILPRSKVVLDMEFEAQVPVQIRRSGRDNPLTEVRYSMSQWYPKICEYDRKDGILIHILAVNFMGYGVILMLASPLIKIYSGRNRIFTEPTANWIWI